MAEENLRLGRFVETTAGGETVRAFVPPPLPPNPSIDMTALASHLSEADRAVGRLDGISQLLPNKELFLYMYVRKEAVLSSQIEGTQSTLADLLRAEADQLENQNFDDITEVSNYVEAMSYGLKRMETLPLSLRLIREMHERLLKSGRGAGKDPGQFRRSQNWIGGTRPGNAIYVPPPPVEMERCLDTLEKYIHNDSRGLPPLVKAGLVHLQFESIHPFLDGNGRIGRLLITLMLCEQGILKEPLLYLSLYFKTKRADYYRLLQEVRERGSWETWLEFFLDGITETANEAVATAMKISERLDSDIQRVQSERKVHRFASAGLRSAQEEPVPDGGSDCEEDWAHVAHGQFCADHSRRTENPARDHRAQKGPRLRIPRLCFNSARSPSTGRRERIESRRRSDAKSISRPRIPAAASPDKPRPASTWIYRDTLPIALFTAGLETTPSWPVPSAPAPAACATARALSRGMTARG